MRMTLTTRSLLLAVLACFALGLFAQSPGFRGRQAWFSGIFLLATFALSIGGLWLGMRGARQERTVRAWLAPGINGFLIVVLLVFLWLLWRALGRLP